ncbi:sugar kinase [Thalassobacillus devorans]|uniref:sugar kinase n=1 Tax=Thalassobacillus devorans TaxID=279813 RepID=UPI000A1C851F|nr:sugar kinase [Thalassobacillus devorans]
MDVVTLGESMVLFASNSQGLLRYANDFSARVAGAESNVMIGLSRLGHKAGWISRIGNDELGQKVRSFIQGEGVDISQVKIDETFPTGIFLKEALNRERSRVYYYRSHSAASNMTEEDIAEDYIANAKYLHITGITPALSDKCYKAVHHAISTAKKHKVKICFDPNLRKNLWNEERARQVLLEIAGLSDIFLPGIDEAEFMFGVSDPKLIGEKAFQLGVGLSIIKLGAEGAYYFTKEDKGLVKGSPVQQVVDPVGAGDGFAAGVLSGLLDGLSPKDSVERGNAIGAMVTLVPGDVEGLPDRNLLDSYFNNQEDVSR